MKLIIYIIGAGLLLSSCHNQNSSKNTLSKSIIKDLDHSVFEIVVSKIEDPSIKYEKELPLDQLSFKDRTDKFYSIGTAFFISKTEAVSAAHVFSVPFPSYFTDYALRDSKGSIYKIKDVLSYSNYKDIVTFNLESYPNEINPLEFNLSSEIGDVVFAVGNAQGEGISFREGQIASYTPEVIDGKWKDIRFSSPASPGNSGGPLINSSGEVIGVIVKKNETENFNYASPIELLKKLSNEKAEFLIKNQGFALFYKEKSLYKDWIDQIELPQNIKVLRTLASSHLEGFYNDISDEIRIKFKEEYPPLAKAFKSYLKDQNYVNGFGFLKTDTDFKKWEITNFKSEMIKLNADQKATISRTNVGKVHVVIEKPKDLPLQEFFTNQKVFMDELLKAIPISRPMGEQNIKVVSLGKPAFSESWEDQLGRKWISSRWNLSWTDYFVQTNCLPYPKGAICNIDFAHNGELSLGYMVNQKDNSNEVVVGYEGNIRDWLEYFKLPKSLIPKSFKDIELGLKSNMFNIKSNEFDISFSDSKISMDSNIHFHFGYADANTWTEDLLLFELLPTIGESNLKFKVQKVFEPDDLNTDEVKSRWKEVVSKRGNYSGDKYLSEDKWSTRFVMDSSKRKIASTIDRKIPNYLFVLGCDFKTSQKLQKECLKFKKSVVIK